MKNMKKVVSFLLAIAMVFAMNFTTAFAAAAPESNNYQPASTTSGDEGIMPLVYDQFHADLPANSSLTLSGFPIPDRYMAVEAYATVMGGGTNSGTFSIFVLDHGAVMKRKDIDIDGISQKIDWIDFKATNNTCDFKMVNNSNVDITIYVTYYSWQ